jgi:hypothetical protein
LTTLKVFFIDENSYYEVMHYYMSLFDFD